MRRLSIIDLAGGGQPIANEDGRIQVVQNGEIYNYRGRGHAFSTHSDTEVLVASMKSRGRRSSKRCAGCSRSPSGTPEKAGCCSPDPFGIKPLYYRVAGGTVSFGSELKALLRQPGFSREIDPQALESFLAFNSIPSPLTIFKEVRKLPAGHTLIAERGEVTVARFARPAPAPADQVRNEGDEALAAELRDRLRDSVRAHLVSDVPVGVLLSGGIDSAALTAMAAGESGYRVSTFSIGFEESSFDELGQARLVAERYGTGSSRAASAAHAVDLLPRLVEAFDEPFGDLSALPTYLVSQLASGTVKAVLSARAVTSSRGLLHICRRPPRAPPGRGRAASAPAGRSAAELLREGELRLQGQALHARRASAAGRAPPRLEGDLLARGPG